MFYQSENSLKGDILKFNIGNNVNFPLHLHTSFELVITLDGELEINIDKKQYILNRGDAVLIFPNQIHSLSTPQRSEHIIFIFSPKLVSAYSKIYLTKIPEGNLFRPSDFYVKKLEILSKMKELSTMAIKGVLYSICAEFDSLALYSFRKETENNLLFSVFHFVECNYQFSCTMSDLTKHTGYHYVYLSRYFKQCTGLSFTEYVNRYRINESLYLLSNCGKTVLQIAFECGFNSLRSFNRNFKKIMGQTPSEYQAKF